MEFYRTTINQLPKIGVRKLNKIIYNKLESDGQIIKDLDYDYDTLRGNPYITSYIALYIQNLHEEPIEKIYDIIDSIILEIDNAGYGIISTSDVSDYNYDELRLKISYIGYQGNNAKPAIAARPIRRKFINKMDMTKEERIKELEEKLYSICEEWGHLKLSILASKNKEIINKMKECENILIKKGLML